MTQGDFFQSQADEAEAKQHEFYRTPRRIVQQLLTTAQRIEFADGTAWSEQTAINGLPDGLWVDAGAGDGAIWSACTGKVGRQFVAVEKRRAAMLAARSWHGPAIVAYFVDDWTGLHFGTRHRIHSATVVVMNSPFSITHEFVQRAFEYCPDAWVWSLQTQRWGKPPVKDKERRAFILDHWPEFKLQCMGGRPSFNGKGTDTQEYIWYGWSPTGRNRQYCRYEGPCKER